MRCEDEDYEAMEPFQMKNGCVDVPQSSAKLNVSLLPNRRVRKKE